MNRRTFLTLGALGTLGIGLTNTQLRTNLWRKLIDAQKEMGIREDSPITYAQEKHMSNNQQSTYNVLRIPATEVSSGTLVARVRTAKHQQLLPIIASGSEAAINGTFFDESSAILGYAKSDQRTVQPKKSNARQTGFFNVRNGVARIERTLDTSRDYAMVLQSHPLLISNSQSLAFTHGKRSYRSAIALDKYRNIYLVTTDNELFTGSKVTLPEFTGFLRSQHYTHALNLDGGATTSMMSVPNGFIQTGYRGTTNAITFEKA